MPLPDETEKWPETASAPVRLPLDDDLWPLSFLFVLVLIVLIALALFAITDNGWDTFPALFVSAMTCFLALLFGLPLFRATRSWILVDHVAGTATLRRQAMILARTRTIPLTSIASVAIHPAGWLDADTYIPIPVFSTYYTLKLQLTDGGELPLSVIPVRPVEKQVSNGERLARALGCDLRHDYD